MPARLLAILLAIVSYSLISSCATNKSPQTQVPPAPKVDKADYKKTPKPKGYPGSHWDFDKIGERDVAIGINWYSIEKEIAFGKQIAQDVEKSAKLIDDPIISEYVNRVGQNLVRNSDAKVPFTIKVLDADEVNAFALPGGFFFVNSGLILAVEAEAELAGVMAHEIAHVAARHGTRQVTRGQIIDLASIPLIFVGGWGGYGIRQAAGLLIPMAFLSFSRNFEEEADELGLQYLYASGYDPVAMLDVFEKFQSMEKKKKGTISKVFSSHPPTGDRINITQKIIEFFPPRGEYAINTSEFDEVKKRVAEVVGQRKQQDEKDREGKPSLRRKNPDKIEPEDIDKNGEKDNNERPTLKRGK